MELQLIQGDITQQKVDAIVNAANKGLWGGGGVDGAIHRAGGPAIGEACKRIREAHGGIETGEAIETTGGRLPASYVIHTAGPVWKQGKEDEEALLAACYQNSLKLAEALDCKSIAFPNISTGVYGFPKDKAAEIAVREVRSYQAKTLAKVVFVCFDEENYGLYEKELNS